jgi:DNA-binding MarR family transcriptional regulator
MILSRITRAVREQNWFAVALEFVIVIAGVVIGFQISQFAEDRSQRASALQILTQVELEIGEIATVRAVTRAGLSRHIDALTGASLVVAGRVEADFLTPEQCEAVASSGRITLAPDALPAIDALLDTGVLSAIGDDALRLAASRFVTKQESVREWARLTHSDLYDLADRFPDLVRYEVSEAPDEDGVWSQRARCELEAMRGARDFQALLMSNLELDRTTRSFVYLFMDDAFEELHAAINAALLGSAPAELAPTMVRDPSL